MKRFKHAFIGFFAVMAMMVFTQNDILAATATVDTSEVHQTIEGFGASLAWWYSSLYSHPQREEIYDYLFDELGLDIFRLRNIYRKGEDYGFAMLGEIVDSFYSHSKNEPKVMISSWSPPADLKSNNNLVGVPWIRQQPANMFIAILHSTGSMHWIRMKRLVLCRII